MCALTIPGEPVKLLSWPKPHLFLPEKWNRQIFFRQRIKASGENVVNSSDIRKNAHTKGIQSFYVFFVKYEKTSGENVSEQFRHKKECIYRRKTKL